MSRVRVGLWGKVGSCIRCAESATCIRCVEIRHLYSLRWIRLLYSLRCIRLLYSLRCIGVQIRCVFVALNPPLVFVALNPPLVFVASASCIRCVALGYKFVALHLESLNICWNRSPCKNWGTNSLCRPSYCRSRLSSHGTWPIAYGALVPVEKSRIVGNAPRLWSPLTFVGIEVHAKIGVQIHCVGQVIVAPASRPMARGL